MSETIELITMTLGLDPYVLLRPETDEDGEVSINVKAGGGVGSKEGIACLLLMVLESLTGMSADPYLAEVNAERQAAGLVPLEEAAQASAGTSSEVPDAG